MELIERGPALELLRDALDSAGRGCGRTALVCGEAGIGKTSLVSELVNGYRDGNVLWGGCEALFSPRPLGPLYDMAPSLGARVKSMLGLDGGRVELFASFLASLQEATGTTVVVLEDLHWADAATLDLVKFLARRIARVRALLVLSYRDDELDERHPLQLVLGDLPANAVVRVPLPPLSEAGVDALARQSRRSAEGIFAATGGNPFFVTEALRAEGLPATVRDAVIARAARQTPTVRAILDLVAIVPGRLETSIVDAVLAPAPGDIAAALACGLLNADGRWYSYRHELGRIAIEQALAGPLAAALHARVLDVLEHQPAGQVAMSRLVHHAAKAGDVAAVLKYARVAADEAASHGAHCQAATLYATALAHEEALTPLERARLYGHLSYQRYLIDENEDAIAARQSALALWRELDDQHEVGLTLRWLSRLYWFGGRKQLADAYADEAVQLLEGQAHDDAYAWALSNRSQLYMLSGHTRESIEWGTRAIELATRLDCFDILAHALNNVGTARYAAGDPEGKAMLERSLQIAREHHLEEHIARFYVNLVSTAAKNREYAQAREQIREAMQYYGERDLDAWANYIQAWQARMDFEQGRWDEAAMVAGRLVALRGAAPITRICALTVLAQLRLRRGDPGAEPLLAEAEALARQSAELQRLAPVASAQAEAAWLRNGGLPADSLVLPMREAAQRLHDGRALGELHAWSRRLGLVGSDPGGEVEAPYRLQFDGHWRAAADQWRALGCPFEHALALLEGDDDAMREGLALLESLEATATLRRCRERLREAGVRGVSRGPRASTSANPAGLTSRELQILELLAEGLTNAEIARRLVRSEKTVDHHISAVLRKLDARTRGEAAATAGRMGLVPERRGTVHRVM